MKTKNFNTVNELSEVACENRMQKFIELAREFAKKANKIESETESFFAKMASKEVVSYFRKSEAADCEYTAYVNANYAEKWLEKAIEANER